MKGGDILAHFVKVHPVNYKAEMAVNLDLVCEVKPMINEEPGCHLYFIQGGAAGHLAVKESVDEIIEIANRKQIMVPSNMSIQQDPQIKDYNYSI